MRGRPMDQIVFSPTSLGSVLKHQRKTKKLSQYETGRPFKIDQTTVSDIEQGAPGTRLETLFRLLAALELEMVIRPKKNTDMKGGDNW